MKKISLILSVLVIISVTAASVWIYYTDEKLSWKNGEFHAFKNMEKDAIRLAGECSTDLARDIIIAINEKKIKVSGWTIGDKNLYIRIPRKVNIHAFRSGNITKISIQNKGLFEDLIRYHNTNENYMLKDDINLSSIDMNTLPPRELSAALALARNKTLFISTPLTLNEVFALENREQILAAEWWISAPEITVSHYGRSHY